MHPILANRERLAVYLLGWLILGGLLAAVVALPKIFTWTEALVLAIPLTLLYGTICLSSWYLCRVFPLERSGWAQLLLLYAISVGVSYVFRLRPKTEPGVEDTEDFEAP